MPDAYLVVGPESSGNRYLVRLLTAAGCVSHHDQFFPASGDASEIAIPFPLPPRLALHRSFPHGGQWPSISRLLAELRRRHYRPTILVPVRDAYCCERSQVKSGHVLTLEQARANIRHAYELILPRIACAGHYLVPYQSLARPEYVAWLMAILGLPLGEHEPFEDGDAKHLLE